MNNSLFALLFFLISGSTYGQINTSSTVPDVANLPGFFSVASSPFSLLNNHFKVDFEGRIAPRTTVMLSPVIHTGSTAIIKNVDDPYITAASRDQVSGLGAELAFRKYFPPVNNTFFFVGLMGAAHEITLSSNSYHWTQYTMDSLEYIGYFKGDIIEKIKRYEVGIFAGFRPYLSGNFFLEMSGGFSNQTSTISNNSRLIRIRPDNWKDPGFSGIVPRFRVHFGFNIR